MKLKLVLIMTVIMTCAYSFADEYYDDVYYFPGVTSEYQYKGTKYKVEQNKLTTQVEHMDKLFSNGKPKVLMGHSAGGLKAMAYASLLNQKGKKNEVKGVITMGAPLKGFTALAQGRNYLNRQLGNKINTLTDAAETIVDTGINAVDVVLPIIMPITQLIPDPRFHYYPGRFTIQGNTIKAKLRYLFGVQLGYMFLERPLETVINAGFLGDDFVTDISPKSTFMNNYINPKTTVKTDGYYKTVKRKTGLGYYEAVWKTKRNCFGWKYSYIAGWKWRDIYKTYQVWVAPTYNYYPRIDKNIPVGMIVGQGNDPLAALDKDIVKNVKIGMEVATNLLIAAEAWHHVKAGFAYASLFFIGQGVQYTKKAIKCSDARYIIRNYVSEYGKLLGSTANDSFITEDSQQYGLDKLGGRTISKKYPGGVAKCSSTHFEEPSHKEIWGDGGSARYDKSSSDESKRQRLKHGSIQRNGILWNFFKAQDWIVYDKDGSVIHE